MKRATVWFCQYRADAETRREMIEQESPDLRPMVTGSPGNWKVTRLVRDDEDPKQVYRGAMA